MSKTAAFTIVAKNYLPFARVLMQSIRAWAPDFERIVILVDQVDNFFDPTKEDFKIILSDQLQIPHSRWFHFKYTILELSTAVKPYAIEYILATHDIDRVFYFDPDIVLYNRLDSLVATLDEHNIVLTPHLTAPLEDDRRPRDLDILRSGAYNLGFIGVRRGNESDRFLRWWQLKLYDQCVVDLPQGLFVDQRWIDLVPGLFGGVGILRDAGLNVAYWNVSHRRVVRTSEGYVVNGEPLRFFHFSGFDPDNPHRFSRHQNRLTLDDLGDASDLVVEYRRQLHINGYAECRSWPYGYGAFENGFPIPDMGRPAHHEAPDLVQRLADPFSVEGYEAFVEAWNQPLAGPDGRPSGITRLAYRIYKARIDVQGAMPDIFGGDLRRFMNWVMSSGRVEHNLGDAFIAPIQSAVRAQPQNEKPVASDPIVNEKVLQTLAATGIWVNGDRCPVQVDALNELIRNGDAKLQLSQLARVIYESRPDLQRFFPDPCGRDGARFLAWFLTYGAREYRLAEVLLAPLRRQWNTVVNSLDGPLQKLWYRCVYQTMAKSVEWRASLSSIRASARITRSIALSRFTGLRRKAPSMRGQHGAEPTRRGKERVLPDELVGANFIGYLQSEMGVGESVRCAVMAARAARLGTAVKSVDSRGPFRRGDKSLGEEDGEHPYPVNVFHVNADQATVVIDRLGPGFVAGRRNIGYWVWELEEFPDRWQSSFRFFDEIWTPSTFCQAAIARKSPVPVVRMPHAVRSEFRSRTGRPGFAIPSDRFVFLAVFDLLSVAERKNPLGVIEAFRHAFGYSSKCHLVLKVNHARHCQPQMSVIREAAAGLPITILDYTMDREDINCLIETCDCLVSLHRSEGFGLTIAEAMYLNTPVIVTAYSGNLDFTNGNNAFLVNYDLVRIPKGCEPYDEGLVWAEPKIDHAVSQMRLVVEHPDVRRARAEKASESIRTQLAPETVGTLMKERLERVASSLLREHSPNARSIP
jgi:glycosyltransferase involved in cell wall biosynthesis